MNGGFDAQQNEFKYVVSIQQSGVHLCSGTIIDEAHILTAAHALIGVCRCELSVVVGMTVVMHPWFRSFSVQAVYVHPHFDEILSPGGLPGLYWENDIAILRLAERLHWNNTYGPVQLINGEVNWFSCLDCVMISWHRPQQNSSDVVTLMWNYVEAVREDECHQRGIHLLTNQKCFIDVLQSSLISSDDLGSPIVCGNLMVGFIVREAENGVAGSPSTFLTTLPYLEFIADIINDGRIDVRPGEFSFIVSIWYLDNYRCGGSLLDTIHILTAGHCVRGLEKTSLKLAAGYTQIWQLDPTIQWLSVHDIIFHGKYKFKIWHNAENWYIEHDIAVIVLSEPVSFYMTFHPIQYENPSAGLLCQVFHWKRENNSIGGEIMKLQVARAMILDHQTCRRLSVPLVQWQFSAGSPHYMYIIDPVRPIALNFLQGDIGTPIICGGRPLGILVKAFPTDAQSPPVPAIFLWLHPYEQFISYAMSRS